MITHRDLRAALSSGLFEASRMQRTVVMITRIAICVLLLATGCSKLLGFNEAKHLDGGVSGDAAPVGPDTCLFDDPSSTFDGSCQFGN
jgi:hypothetical protein